MSNNNSEKLFEETKMQIRSVIQSQKGGLTLRKVQLDFQNFFGFTIPHRELGYYSAEAFLKSIPDVVHCHYEGASLMCSAVADEKTKHIEKLIDKQRSHPRPPRNTSYGWDSSNYGRSQAWGDSSRRYLTARRATSYGTGTGTWQRNSQRNSSALPEWINSDWRSRNQNYAKNSSEEDYTKYSSNQNYSKSSSELNYVKPVQYSGSSSQQNVFSSGKIVEKSANTMVNRSGVVPNVQGEVRNKVSQSVSVPEDVVAKSKISSVKIAEVQRLLSSEKKVCDSRKSSSDLVFRYTGNSKTESTANTNSNERLSKPIAATKSNQTLPSKNTKSAESWEDYSYCNDFSLSSYDAQEIEPISKRLKEEFFQLLELESKGIWLNELPRLYENQFKKRFDYEELGYISLSDLIATIPNVFKTYRPQPTADWLLFDARKDNSKIISSMSSEAERSPTSYRVSDHFKKQLIQVLNCSKDGILSDDLNHWFKSYFGSDIPFKQFGFSSVNELIFHLVDDVISLETTSSGYVIKHQPEANFCFGPALNSKDKLSEMMKTIPVDAAVKCTIQLQQLPTRMTRDECFAVIPSHIYGPNCFYVQLRGEATTIALDNLMDELEKVYSSRDADLYEVPEKYLDPGLICTALYEYENSSGSEWHRAIITNVVKDEVEVDFFDYGTKGIVKKTAIRFLKKQFTTLPVQAREAKLGNIEPLNNREWSELARKEFFEAVGGKELMAQLIGVTVNPIKKTPVLSLCLIDTCRSDEKDVDINKLLVDNGLAQFCDEFSNDARNSCSNMYYGNPMEWLAQTMMINQWAMNCNMPYMQSMMPNMPACMNMSGMLPNSFRGSMPNASNPYEYLAQNMAGAANLQQEGAKGDQRDFQEDVEESRGKVLNNSKGLPNELNIVREPAEENSSWSSKNTPENHETKEPVDRKEMSETDEFDQLNRDLEQITMSKKRFVKKTSLASRFTVKLILHNGELHLTSKEVSSFFWDHDLLKNKLRIHGIKVPFQLVNESEDPELYRELVAHKLCGTTGQQLGVTIYPIKFVGKIIDAFSKDLASVKEAIAHELDKFDPNDSYWGNSDDGISIGNASDELEDGIELALGVLRHRKCTVESQLKIEEKRFLREELGLLNERINMLEKELK